MSKTVLITSGATKIYIDDIRYISNFSTGSFPSKIASACLSHGHRVIYFHAKSAQKPHTHQNLLTIEFETYDDYAQGLQQCIQKHCPSIIFLGAAVSDFGVKKHTGKLRSNEDRPLHLQKLPKVIKSIKTWSQQPVFQVGFKLSSRLQKESMIETAYTSGVKNRSDLTLANDYHDIKHNKRISYLITPEKGVISIKGPQAIVDFVMKRSQGTYFKTQITHTTDYQKTYEKEIKKIQTSCASYYKKGYMPDYYTGAGKSHGSISLRTGKESFLITARKSHKKNLTANDIVHVKSINWTKRIIHVESHDAKASHNATLTGAVFQKLPDMHALIHTHTFSDDAPYTSFPFTPGTREYAFEAATLLKQKPIINLIHHGLIAIGKTFDEAHAYVTRS